MAKCPRCEKKVDLTIKNEHRPFCSEKCKLIDKSKRVCYAILFPTIEPKYVLIVMLEDTKLSKDYVYNYRNKPGSCVGTPFNTAGWTSVEVAAKIIEQIGPILATKY